jgi:GT2 family glycosyltransferase
MPDMIFGPCGGLALLRRALIDDVSDFPAEFFSYLEDADLAWRSQLRGWGTRLAPTALARHVYSASGGQGSPLKQRMLARNRLRVLVRCMPGPLLRECLPAIAAYDLLAVGYAALRGQWPTAAGRAEALAELPALLSQRRAIQARRTAAIGDLSRWLRPAPSPLANLHEQRRLGALLSD